MNIQTDERKDENYIPVGINARGIMNKQLSNVIFDIVIALRIGIHNFTPARAMDTAKIPFGHIQTFPYCEKSEIPQKGSYCTCRINFYCVWQNVFFVRL